MNRFIYETMITKIYHINVICIECLFVNPLVDRCLPYVARIPHTFVRETKKQLSKSPFLTVRTPIRNTKHHHVPLSTI